MPSILDRITKARTEGVAALWAELQTLLCKAAESGDDASTEDAAKVADIAQRLNLSDADIQQLLGRAHSWVATVKQLQPTVGSLPECEKALRLAEKNNAAKYAAYETALKSVKPALDAAVWEVDAAKRKLVTARDAQTQLDAAKRRYAEAFTPPRK